MMVLIQFSRGKKYYRPKLDNIKDILRFLQQYLFACEIAEQYLAGFNQEDMIRVSKEKR